MDTNPYQAPTAPHVGPPLPNLSTVRPTILTVLGILNLVFAGLGVIGLMIMFAMLAAVDTLRLGTPNPVFDALRTNEVYRNFTILQTAVGCLSIIVLIASGVGLLQMRRYGRTLAIVYSIYALLAGVVGMIINIAFVFGPMLENAQGRAGPEQFAALGGMVGGIVGGVVGLAYPAILLFCMYRPSVRNALR